MLRLPSLCCLTAGLLASACQWTLTAQTPTEQARALEARLPAPQPPQGRESFELSEARQERLKKLLPDTWRKLSQREPLNILVLAGERELEIWSEVGKAGLMNTFPAQFARELANQFFYTSGVHEAGKAAHVEALAPGITLRFLSGQDHALVDAASILGSVARQAPVDLVLICHGLAEADADMSPQSYVRLMNQAVDAARELKAEVFIAAPWLEASAQPEATLGVARPLADALREAAEDEGWMFADLGDLTRVMQMPPSDAQGDAQRFDRFASTWRSFFHEEKSGSHLPRATLHQRMGSALFETMLDGPAPQPLSFEEASATWKEGGAALEMHCTVVNGSKQEQRLTVLPLIAAGWKPREAQPEVTLAAGTKKTLVIQYVRSSAGQITADESIVRLPLLIISGSQACVVTQRAVLQPVAVVWSSDTLFNQEARFVIGGQILNTSTDEVRGTWEAEFAGNQLNGQMQLKPGAAQPLDLTFAVPTDDAPLKHSVLTLKVKLPGIEFASTRQITLAKNMGLNLPVQLTASAKSIGSVTLQAGADAGRVSFLCEISGPEMLLPTVDGSPAWQLEVNLDARSYGKRLEAGSTAPVRITGTAVAGKGNVLPIQAWAFGTGYAAVFDPKMFQAELKSLGGNQHRIMLTIPRTYLYMHEWALNNGNSQFGLNARLTLNTAHGYQTWSLVPTVKPANDTAAMAVLELSAKPTQRATVIVE